jgi:hypothetical protein
LVNIHHFYHVYSDGSWKLPLSTHIGALNDSGLIDHVSKIHIGIAGEKRQDVEDYLKQQSFDFEILPDANSNWEQQTLIPLHKFSEENTGVVFYAHTKGASSTNSYSLSWRTSMTFFCVIKWRENIEYLKEFDIVGCHWIESRIEQGKVIAPFFGGNFWWANCSYISKLKSPPNNNRWEAEVWLTSNHITDFPKYKDIQIGWPKDENFTFGW